MKDAFTNTFTLEMDDKDIAHREAFSYLGSQNNPPDFIIRNGDSFEVKKIQVEQNKRGSTHIQLNSSPPKSILHAGDRRITNVCRNCEQELWEVKQHFYVVGHVLKSINHIRELFFIHGLCYCGAREFYNPLHDNLKEHIDRIIELNEYNSKQTVELGKIYDIDPLDITELRIRAMWLIKSPFRLYEEYGPLENHKNFILTALLTEDQYNSYPVADRRSIEDLESLDLQRIQIPDPNIVERTINAFLLKISW